jgi:hypothetical protein
MFKKTALIAGIGLALSAGAQADYRWELGAGYEDGSVDSDLRVGNERRKNDNDIERWEVYGTWYMETVDTSKGPLGEAAFLDHASWITLGYEDGEIDFSNFDDIDGDSYNFDMRYVAEGPGWKLSGWLVDLGYERREPGDSEIDFYSIGIGKYIFPNTTLVAEYEQINLNNGGDTDAYGASLDHFFAFNNGGLKVGLNGGKVVVSGEDDVEEYGIDGTWYLGNHWGFSAGYAKTEQNSYEIDAWNVGVEWFITENWAVDLQYYEADPDDINFGGGDKLETEIDSVTLNTLVRF